MDNDVCIDASLALAWLLPKERSQATDGLILQWHTKGMRLITAPLFHPEVASVIRQQVYFKKLPPEEGEDVFSLYLQLKVETVDEPEIYHLAWELARKFNLPRTYGMQYLAVAELRDCELWTNDTRFINSLQGKAPRLRWAGEYNPGEKVL